MICGVETLNHVEALQIRQRTGLPSVRVVSTQGTVWVFVSEKPVEGFAPVLYEPREQSRVEHGDCSVACSMDGGVLPPLRACWRVGSYLRVVAGVVEEIEDARIDVVERGNGIILDGASTLRTRSVRFTAHEVSEATGFTPKVFETASGRKFENLRITEVPARFLRVVHEASSKLYFAGNFGAAKEGVYDLLGEMATARPSVPKPAVQKPEPKPKTATSQTSAQDRLDVAERSGASPEELYKLLAEAEIEAGRAMSRFETIDVEPPTVSKPTKNPRKRGGLKWKLRLAKRSYYEAQSTGAGSETLAGLQAAVDAAQAAVDEKFGAQPERKPDMALKAARTGDLPVLVVH